MSSKQSYRRGPLPDSVIEQYITGTAEQLLRRSVSFRSNESRFTDRDSSDVDSRLLAFEASLQVQRAMTEFRQFLGFSEGSPRSALTDKDLLRCAVKLAKSKTFTTWSKTGYVGEIIYNEMISSLPCLDDPVKTSLAIQLERAYWMVRNAATDHLVANRTRKLRRLYVACLKAFRSQCMGQTTIKPLTLYRYYIGGNGMPVLYEPRSSHSDQFFGTFIKGTVWDMHRGSTAVIAGRYWDVASRFATLKSRWGVFGTAKEILRHSAEFRELLAAKTGLDSYEDMEEYIPQVLDFASELERDGRLSPVTKYGLLSELIGAETWTFISSKSERGFEKLRQRHKAAYNESRDTTPEALQLRYSRVYFLHKDLLDLCVGPEEPADESEPNHTAQDHSGLDSIVADCRNDVTESDDAHSTSEYRPTPESDADY